MAFLDIHTPWRVRLPFAKWSKKLRIMAAPVPPVPKGISAKQARDIGLTPHDLEQLRFEWPSDGPHRPLI